MTPSDDMLCQSYDEDYSALLDGELTADRSDELEAHLESCDHCRARVASLQRVDAELSALGSSAVPADLRARLQARIDATPEARPERAAPGRVAPRRKQRWLSAPLAAAAVAAAAAITLYLALSPEEGALPSAGAPEPRIAREETPPPKPEALPEPLPELREPAPIAIAEESTPAPVAIAEESTPAPLEVAEEPIPAVGPERALAGLDAEPVDDVAVALDLETIEDLDVIANLELLEALLAMEEGTG